MWQGGLWDTIKQYRKTRAVPPDLAAQWASSADAVALVSLHALSGDRRELVRAAHACLDAVRDGGPDFPGSADAFDAVEPWLRDGGDFDESLVEGALDAWTNEEIPLASGGPLALFGFRELYVARAAYYLVAAITDHRTDAGPGSGCSAPAHVRAPAARAVDACAWALANPDADYDAYTQAADAGAPPADLAAIYDRFTARYHDAQAALADVVRGVLRVPFASSGKPATG